MDIKRILRHLFTPHYWVVKHHFPSGTLQAIEEAIRRSEATHSGQLRFAVEGTLEFWPLIRNQSAQDRAIEVFSNLHIWDTEHNNGVLIYLLITDKDVEIVADRGIHGKVGTQGWETICGAMEELFRQGKFEEGVLYGIKAVSESLAKEFPSEGPNVDELPNRPVIL